MTVLAELTRGLVSIQCDVCVPPVLTINTPADLRRTGWTLASANSPYDACPTCTVRLTPRNRLPRADPTPVSLDPAVMPNLFVVGATKAGTTSMHNYLELHPDIVVSTDKELRFLQDPHGDRWLGIYQSQFRPGTRYRAESTPFYSKSPCFPGVVDRMADLVPDARVIYLVRDPVDRIIAEYAEQLQWNAASRSLDDELADPEDPRNWLVASSRYATQLREYRRRFGDHQIIVVDLADLARDIVETMGEVFDALGLERPPLSPEDFVRFNTRADKNRVPTWLMRLRRGPIVRMLRRMPDRPREALSRFALRRFRTPVATPTIENDTLTTLRAVLQTEVDDLRELTGRPFANWSL